MANRRLFVRFTKIDEETRTAMGRMTQEIVDRDDEIFDYDASLPHVKAWSSSFEKATDGKSLGNLRAMHQNISAGKVTAIDYNDVEKAIDIAVKVVDDAEWEKTREGVYTGFSIGGTVVRSWRDPKQPMYKRFEVRPSEVSLADYPCVPSATFSYVKTGGTSETRHFKKVADPMAKNGTTDGFAYADEGNKRLPLFNKTMVRASLALWGHSAIRDAYTAKEADAIGRKLRAAATEHGIAGVTEKAMRRGDYSKSLYDVGRLAELVSSLAWLQESARYERESEADDSTVPDQLCDHVAALLDTLNDMLGEESAELLQRLGRQAADDAASTKTASTEGAPMADQGDKTETNKTAGTPAPTTPVVSDDFQKVGKKHVAKVAEVHDHMKAAHTMLGAGIEKIAGFLEEVSGQSTTKPSADEDVDGGAAEKVAKTEFTKVAAERDDWQKRHDAVVAERDEATTKLAAAEAQIEELLTTGEEMTKALETRKGKLIAVDKATDGQAALRTETTATVAKVAATEPASNAAPHAVDRGQLHASFKKAFGSPQIPGMPGDASK